jgi:hypothetical protein
MKGEDDIKIEEEKEVKEKEIGMEYCFANPSYFKSQFQINSKCSLNEIIEDNNNVYNNNNNDNNNNNNKVRLERKVKGVLKEDYVNITPNDPRHNISYYHVLFARNFFRNKLIKMGLIEN